jgi:hypothetical protein
MGITRHPLFPPQRKTATWQIAKATAISTPNGHSRANETGHMRVLQGSAREIPFALPLIRHRQWVGFTSATFYKSGSTFNRR